MTFVFQGVVAHKFSFLCDECLKVRLLSCKVSIYLTSCSHRTEVARSQPQNPVGCQLVKSIQRTNYPIPYVTRRALMRHGRGNEWDPQIAVGTFGKIPRASFVPTQWGCSCPTQRPENHDVITWGGSPLCVSHSPQPFRFAGKVRPTGDQTHDQTTEGKATWWGMSSTQLAWTVARGEPSHLEQVGRPWETLLCQKKNQCWRRANVFRHKGGRSVQPELSLGID